MTMLISSPRCRLAIERCWLNGSGSESRSKRSQRKSKRQNRADSLRPRQLRCSAGSAAPKLKRRQPLQLFLQRLRHRFRLPTVQTRSRHYSPTSIGSKHPRCAATVATRACSLPSSTRRASRSSSRFARVSTKRSTNGCAASDFKRGLSYEFACYRKLRATSC